MKKLLFFSALALFAFASCSDDDDSGPETVTVNVDTSRPVGTFTVNRTGAIVDQNGAGSAGTADLGTDSNGDQFLRLSNNFTSNFGTGTITVYLSKVNQDLNDVFDPGNGNSQLRLLGGVTSGGERFFKVTPAAGTDFEYMILWCASAAVPFGFADLN